MGKKLGQHFLHSSHVLDSIVHAAALHPGDPVLEIGPGRGALTERLRDTGARLCVAELDPVLAAQLRERWKEDQNFRLIEGDILKLPLSPEGLFGASPTAAASPGAPGAGDAPFTAAPYAAAPYSIVANLPYYLTTPLLFRLAMARAHFSHLVLMLQLEVGQRILASPEDGKEYGSLSIAMQHAFSVRMVCRVPPSAFRPPPKVSSVVLHFTPLPPMVDPEREAAFFLHVKTLFTRRRKRMASVLKTLYGEASSAISSAAVARAGELVGERRAEVLTPAEHLEVFSLLHPESPGGF